MLTSTDQAQIPPLEDSVLPFRKGDIDYSTSEERYVSPFREGGARGICDCGLSIFTL